MIARTAKALALLALLAPLAFAQPIQGVARVTLAADYDLDGAAASATAVHSADVITDSASFTIDAQPDAPRPLEATLTDADASITACTYTVVGRLADGTIVTATTALTGGSGQKVLSPNYNFATVTSASVGVCTGEGGADTVSLGTTATIPDVFVLLWGKRVPRSQGFYQLDIFSWIDEIKTLKTSGSSTTVVSGVASSAAFKQVAIGDVLTFSIVGDVIERLVTAKASDDSITVNDAVNVATAVPFRIHKPFAGPDADDGWIGVQGFAAVSFVFNVEQLSESIQTVVQCRVQGTGSLPVTIMDTAVAAAGVSTQTVDLSLIGYDQCRAGLGFTAVPDGADGGANNEVITVQFTGVRQ